jgi:peptide-methionine (S)-S-oxide reductase
MIRLLLSTAALGLLVAATVSTWQGACSTRNAMTHRNVASTIGQETPESRTRTAIFAAGCFWGVESTFRSVEGVVETEVGYIGGHVENPTYKQVCSDRTGHAEAVRVVYDPDQVDYEKLLEVFWSCHDPTQKNRQGPDVGSQYRSAIFYTGQQQKDQAQASRTRQGEKHQRPVATEITEAGTFWPAEEYHQQYLEKTGRVCH